MTLTGLVDGPKDGPVVLFLHGFPDFSHGWRKQISFFVAKGFRVIAPDLPGYAGTSKPKDLARYKLGSLAADVLKLLDAFKVERCHIVGHDWGASLTWNVVDAAPQRFMTATVICVPHMKVFLDHVRHNKHGQLLRSWYMILFQIPVLSESLFKLKGGRWFAGLLAQSARKGTFSEEDQAAYAAAWQVPGAPTGMLNWYRANMRGKRRPSKGKIVPPMLILWGDRDSALNHHMAEDSLPFCEKARIQHFPEGTHWVHVEHADAVNASLLAHFQERP